MHDAVTVELALDLSEEEVPVVVDGWLVGHHLNLEGSSGGEVPVVVLEEVYELVSGVHIEFTVLVFTPGMHFTFGVESKLWAEVTDHVGGGFATPHDAGVELVKFLDVFAFDEIVSFG